MAVHVSADSGDWCDHAKVFENLQIADVACMQNVIDAL